MPSGYVEYFEGLWNMSIVYVHKYYFFIVSMHFQLVSYSSFQIFDIKQSILKCSCFGKAWKIDEIVKKSDQTSKKMINWQNANK